MSDLEVAKLYTVTDPLDRPVRELISGQTEVAIQFNPSSLKVSLANSLKENERNGNTRAAQFVDKSSSNLTVELIFDTSDQYFTRTQEGSENEQEEVQKDVRTLTKPIATTFMASDSVGDDTVAPQRCLFAWGTFAFVGIMESFDETLDFFSPKGTPLRATVAIKLSESRFQFRTEEAQAAERDTPSLGSGPPAQAAKEEGKKDKDWRDTAMYNGIESARNAAGGLSVPSASATASLQASASASIGGGISGGFGAGIGGGAGLGIGGGLSAGISGGLSAGVSGGLSASAGIGGGLSAGLSGGIGGSLSAGVGGSIGIDGGLSAGITSDLGGLTASAKITPPAFSFGASSSLGTSIPGAFSPNLNTASGLTAGSIVSGGVSVSGGGVSTSSSASSSSSSSFSSSSSSFSSSSSASASAGASVSAKANASVGFD